jgi:hypothetical protein
MTFRVEHARADERARRRPRQPAALNGAGLTVRSATALPPQSRFHAASRGAQ